MRGGCRRPGVRISFKNVSASIMDASAFGLSCQESHWENLPKPKCYKQKSHRGLGRKLKGVDGTLRCSRPFILSLMLNGFIRGPSVPELFWGGYPLPPPKKNYQSFQLGLIITSRKIMTSLPPHIKKHGGASYQHCLNRTHSPREKELTESQLWYWVPTNGN